MRERKRKGKRERERERGDEAFGWRWSLTRLQAAATFASDKIVAMTAEYGHR